MTLSDFLKRSKLSGNAFGKRIGYTRMAVSRWLRGIAMPSPDAIQRIYEATGGKVTANDWFHGERK